jgi:hypothetical protein
MVKPNYAWLHKELDYQRSLLHSNCPWSLFESTNAVYDKLGTGEDKDLVDVSNLIGRHLCLTHVPLVRYEWGLKLSPQAVGQIKLPGTVASIISVPFFCVGKPYLVGAVLAHEMSHQWLFLRGIWYDDEDINEKVTDLTSFTTGLGKLVLNGLSREASGVQDMALKLGYLELELMLYAYHIINKWNGISQTHSEKHLKEDVMTMVRKFRAPIGIGLLRAMIRRDHNSNDPV